jgi:hypothetical protein
MNSINCRERIPVLFLAALLLTSVSVADTVVWPHEIDTAKAKVEVYQPQPESLQQDILSARAVVAVTPAGKTEPALGTVWLKARIEADRDNHTAALKSIEVTQTRFPDADAAKEADLASILNEELPNWDPVMDLDELRATLEVAKVQRKQATKLNNDPPEILYVDYPALLVSLDGKPVYQQVENSNLTRVANTPFVILIDYRTGSSYLFDGRDWLEAPEVMGPWKASTATPPEIVDMTPGDRADQSIEKELQDASSVPKIVVATKPTELIVTTGAAKYADVEGTDLAYVSNTETRLLKAKSSGTLYVLLSGRWYTSSSLQGPWTYLPATELPADFAKIPASAEIGEVLTSVPGTQQAKDAVLDAQIPHTTTVKRDQTIAVHYDGAPQWKPIEGTQMRYAANSQQAVIQTGGKYFCADTGVWYAAAAATGPWAVATKVPDEIYTIPADSPVYNVTNVEVFGSTEDEAYVGYYPGYHGSYAYGNTMVYGTGYYYPPWRGAHYYARPSTWGFQVHYNPYGGWSFGYSYASGYFNHAVGFRGWDPCCWWGPARWGARGPYDPRGPFDPRGPHDPRGRYDTRGPYGRRGVGAPRGVADSRGTEGLRAGQFGGPGVGANNLYADRNGNVFRNSNQGWERHGGGGWNAAAASPGLQNHSFARQRGASMSHGGGRRVGGRRR